MTLLIQKEKLEKYAEHVLVYLGETRENAKIVAESMVRADMRGVSTHGTYLLEVIKMRKEGGQITLPTRVDVVSDRDATVLLNGNDGIGMVAGHKAIDMAMEKAQKYGIGMVLLGNTNNVGTLSTYTQKAADHGMIAFMCGNAAPSLAPWGGMEAFLGTSPFSIGIPVQGDLCYNADMATTVVARGKIRKALREGKEIPVDWALDENGMPTTDPGKAMRGTLYPIGGPKGSAIAMTVDIIAGLLSGSNFGKYVKSFHALEGPTCLGVAFIVFDPGRFMPKDTFNKKMQGYICDVKKVKCASGFNEILLPGEIEYRKGKESEENGIVIDDKQFEKLSLMLKTSGWPID
jgi:LDH2 family malate/lactate/ureidoglycolate dehydrogenase